MECAFTHTHTQQNNKSMAMGIIAYGWVESVRADLLKLKGTRGK